MSPLNSKSQLKPVLWFTLYELLKLGAVDRSVKVSTTGLSRILGCSQQSASRHLRLLEQAGLVARRIGSDGSLIRITEEGRRALEEVFFGLKVQFEEVEGVAFELEGVVFSGMYQGAYYIAQEGYRRQIIEKLGFDPYPGTLNLRLSEGDLEKRLRLDGLPSVYLEGFSGEDRAFGGARCHTVLVNGEVEGAIIAAERTSYDLSVLEVIAPVSLRERFGLEDGDAVRVSISGPRRSSS